MSANVRLGGAAPAPLEKEAAGEDGLASQLLDKIEEYHPSRLIAWLQQRCVLVEEVPALDVGLGNAVCTEDHYAALQISPEADSVEIRRAYRRLALETHPDKPSGDQQRFLDVARAYTTLSDPGRREAYDMEWRRSRQDPAAARLRLPPRVRMRLRPGREVLGEVAGDLAAASAAAAEALIRLREAVSSQLPASKHDEIFDTAKEFGVRWLVGDGKGRPPSPPRAAAPPAGASGRDFL
mmetsp:Transcript_111968/g.348906  ORF Transcript_111968/g.348906 Transcript_111968/m.348906 type:complete len:238 (-) Transcript_111968:82-795(-)